VLCTVSLRNKDIYTTRTRFNEILLSSDS